MQYDCDDASWEFALVSHPETVAVGRSFLPVNLDKLEYFDPEWLGSAYKLKPQAEGFGIPIALMVLLAASNGRGSGDFGVHAPDGIRIQGRWAGDRVAVVGDDANDDDLPNAPIPASEIYGSCRDGRDFTDISQLVAAWFEGAYGGRFVGVPGSRGVPGTRYFIYPGQTVYRWNRGELEAGFVVELTEHRVVITWPNGPRTSDLYAPDFIV